MMVCKMAKHCEDTTKCGWDKQMIIQRLMDGLWFYSGWFWLVPSSPSKSLSTIMVVYNYNCPEKKNYKSLRGSLWTLNRHVFLPNTAGPSAPEYRIHFQTHCTRAVTKEDTRCPANSSVWTIWLNQPSDQESRTNMTAIYAPKSVKYTPNLPLLSILYTLHCRQKWQIPLYHGQLVGSTPPSSSFSFPLASLVPSSLAPHLTCSKTWGNGHHQ